MKNYYFNENAFLQEQSPDACRIHFKYIESKDKIYIGHSGKHLDTAEG